MMHMVPCCGKKRNRGHQKAQGLGGGVGWGVHNYSLSENPVKPPSSTPFLLSQGATLKQGRGGNPASLDPTTNQGLLLALAHAPRAAADP